MHIKESPARKAFNIFNILFMIVLMFITGYPLLYVLFASLSDSNLLMAHKGLLLYPLGFNWEAYRVTLDNPVILSGYKNTFIILVLGLTINLLMTMLGAYFLSRKNIMFKNLVMKVIMVTMFIGGGMVPSYLLIKSLGLLDTLWALVLPGAISTYNMIIMRTAFQGVPESLEESAKLDGASHIVILFRIVLPLTIPTMAVMLLYYGVGHWNSWFGAMLYLQRRTDLHPLQLILRSILIENQTGATASGNGDVQAVAETIKYAVTIVSTVPILCLYPFLQKYFVKGLTIGAIKG